MYPVIQFYNAIGFQCTFCKDYRFLIVLLLFSYIPHPLTTKTYNIERVLVTYRYRSIPRYHVFLLARVAVVLSAREIV